MAKGVTPVISSILLMAIVVSASILVYIWSISQLEGFRMVYGDEVDRAKHLLEEELLIEDVWDPGNGTLLIYVRNIGKVEAVIVDVLLLDVNDELIAAEYSLNIYLSPGDVSYISISYSGSTPFKVVVATEKGGRFEVLARG